MSDLIEADFIEIGYSNKKRWEDIVKSYQHSFLDESERYIKLDKLDDPLMR